MLARIWNSLVGWLDRTGLWPVVYRGEHVDDLPDNLKRATVYIVGEDGYDWTAAMLCPGGCGKTLEMNLLPDAKPVWQVREQPNRIVTLHPSIWMKTGCACHFVLRNGRVRWV